MKNLLLILPRIAAIALITSAAAVGTAQSGLPIDSQAWKARCTLLSNASAAIQTGKVPTVFTAATRGVPARGFLVLAVNRAQEGQHYVACTMYFMAAVADRAGNGSTPNSSQTLDEAIIGGSELKLARHHRLNLTEHEKRIKFKVEEVTGKPLTLTSAENEAVLCASTTMPISMTP